MTDAQLLTLAIAIILPLSMLLYSNSRISDTKETLRAEIGESKQTLRMEMQTLHSEIAETKHTLRMEMQALRSEPAETKQTLHKKMEENKQTLRMEMQTLQMEMQVFRGGMAEGFSRMEAQFASIHTALKVHELEHHR